VSKAAGGKSVKRFSNATQAVAARHPNLLARATLVFLAALLVMLLALMTMSSGPRGVSAFAQATPTSTAPSTEPSIKLLNPSQAYDPGLLAPPRPPGEGDPPKISDKFDGIDRLYHVVAITQNAPANATVEAYFQPEIGIEMTVGVLTPVPNTPDTWEMFWDIPDNMLAQSGTFKAVLFGFGSTGFEEIASDETEVDINREDETAEFTWPSQGGQLGFHKPKGGMWRTVVEGFASAGSNRVAVAYSTTPPGKDLAFTRCAYVNIGATANDRKAFVASCALAGRALPSEVTAMAVIAVEDDTPSPATNANAFTQDSADVHRVLPYVQDVSLMTVQLEGLPGANGELTDANYPTGRRRTAMRPFDPTANPFPTNCLKFQALVKDHLGRPVQGANLDAHLVGPNDQAGFGSDSFDDFDTEDSVAKHPDKGSHPQEGRRRCADDPETPNEERGAAQQTQGEHNVPGGADIKHIETALGTGLDPVSATSTAFKFGPGESRFFLFSFQPGFTELTVWVDEEPLVDEATARELDDDTLEPTEPSASIRAQWLPAPVSLSVVPRIDAAPVGTCSKYTVRARAGAAVVPNINIDVHAQGPNNDLDFCDPGDGTPRRAPEQPTGDAAHQGEDEAEASHRSASPDTPQSQHTEAETDDDGNFVFGLFSTGTGSTQITAWIDGERDRDNDVQDSGEVSASASKRWAASAVDAEVRFVNPSGYGGSGDRIARTRDADQLYHLVARVDLPDAVPGVEFFYISGSTVTRIGAGTRVEDSDTWELFWDVNVPDGSYTLRAQIIGTEKREDRAVTIKNAATANNPREPAFETAELTRPLNATAAPFENNATPVQGVASAAARGVELYYTKTAASETRNTGQWIRCASITLPGGTAPQNFQGSCTLASADVPLDVTGIAALAFICEPTGCSTQQGQDVGRIRHSGDAHRVFGFEGNPVVSIEPAETAGQTTTCQRFVLSVADRTGRGIPDTNVDVHLTGPTDTAEFCDPGDGSPRRTPDRAGHTASATQTDEGIHQEEGSDVHHTEGETGSGGEFVFGITSGTSGDSQIFAWVDQNDNDEFESNERSDTSLMHWGGDDPGPGPSKCTIKGDATDNVLRGTPDADIICGGGGDDVIRGRGGNDKIYGGGGDDSLRGNAGKDVIKGGRGADRLDGGRGQDSCRPGRGRDSRVRCES
jgi:Ca2+-binding RTX toxin-like protein